MLWHLANYTVIHRDSAFRGRFSSVVLAVGIVALLAMMPRGTVTATAIDNGQAGYSESESGQRQAPKGSSINGYPFQVLTTVKITSGTLTITLADDADGVLSADAVAISTTTAISQPTLLRLELVTGSARTAAPGQNDWGGNKLRIIRMSNGDLYTVYNTDSPTGQTAQWNLAKRNANGTWSVVATRDGISETVNLLRGPQDQIYLTYFDVSSRLPYLTTSTDGVHFGEQAIPGAWQASNSPYSAAGIAPNGDLYVTESDYNEKPSKLYVGYRTAADGQWHFTTINTDYRYCYNYLFPALSGQLQILGQRDVQWSTLGWTQPPGKFGYAFDGLRQFRTTDITSQPFQNTLLAQELPSFAGEDVSTLHRDVYVDPSNNMHILYTRQGPDTSDSSRLYSAIMDTSGNIIKDVLIGPSNLGQRMVQSPTTGNYYVIDRTGLVTNAGADGTGNGAQTKLNLQGYGSYGVNGIFWAAPRGGTQLSNIWDGVFASGSGNQWVYIRIQLP
jgi:hypothetical protein